MVRFWNTSRPSVNSRLLQAQLDDQSKNVRAAQHEALAKAAKHERERRAV